MNINIGMDEQQRQDMAASLAKVLASTYTLYLKTQKFHWNVTGPHFHSLHEMFEQQYTDLALAVDGIAERIRALGVPAPGSYNEFLKLSEIKDSLGDVAANDMVKTLVTDNETLIHILKHAFPHAEKASDQPSIDLLTQRMHTHEKHAWMLRSSVES